MSAAPTRAPRPLVLACALIAAHALAAPPDAAAGERFTLETFLEIPTLGAPVLSPDGSRVAYVRQQRSLAEDTERRQIWLAPTGGGTPTRITYGPGSPREVSWRPGGGIGYLLEGEHGAPQVWFNPLDGSEPRPLTDLPQGVAGYRWAPDGRRLALLARPRPDEPGDEAADWTVFDRLEQPETYPQLWVLPVSLDGASSDEPRALTEPPLYAHHVTWSPDGTTLALTYNPRFSSLVDEEQRIALVDVETGERETISPPNRHASLAAFSPDGRHLAYFVDRDAEMRAYLNMKDVAIRDLESGQTRVPTSRTRMTLGGSGSIPAQAPAWTADGEHLALIGVSGTSKEVYRVRSDGQGSLEAVTAGEGNTGSFDLAAGRIAYTVSQLHRPGGVRVAPLDDPESSRVVDTTDPRVSRFGLEPPRKVSLPGHGPLSVEGFLFLPASSEPPHPTIVEMHGGPYYRYGNAWTDRYPWHVLAGAGFAVFIANPRGGTGYGEEFLRGNYRGFGTDDYRDLMAAVDALVERGLADPDRLGFTGYSYGGLMTNTVVSRTGRFRAAVSIAGLFNFVSAMGQNNPQLLIDAYRRPWDADLARLWDHSPASRASSIETPTLIMHGEDDQAVDPRQSIEMFTYLQLNGVPSRLVLYPGEGHGIDRPSHMRDYLQRELDWFRYYLLEDPQAEGAAPPVPVEP